MQFGLAFNYVLGRTGGFTNLLLITICNFIPIIGPIVGMGYRAEVSLALLRDEERRRHPKFDFNKFTEYLTRGLWPFVTGLIVGLCAAGLAMLAFLIGMLVAMAQPETGMIIAIVGYVGILVGSALLAAPMRFHAELRNKFDFMAALRFAKSFWLTVGAQAILTWLFFVPLSMVVIFLGMLACFVGIYPAAALVQMAGQHLMVQLYDEYLDRGGEPIRSYDPRYDDDDYEDDYDDEEDEEPRPRRRRRRRDEDDDEDD